jgi:N-acetylglucosamine kinase-like BadF-type ATPase
MMIAIADCGASKTAWRFLDQNGNVEQEITRGFNPYHQSAEQFITDLKEKRLNENRHVGKLYFYGAGCKSSLIKEKVKGHLIRIFRESTIEIEDDLLGAARALCGRERGIVCILGTGSNSALYDGFSIVDGVESLGYILADEGSGTYMGKELLKAFLRKTLPQHIYHDFFQTFSLEKHVIMNKLKDSAGAAEFLAAFGPFLLKYSQDPYISRLILNALQTFFDSNIKSFSEFKSIPVHFSGGIAYHFNRFIRKLCKDEHILIGNVIESPIAGLTLYHQQTDFSA